MKDEVAHFESLYPEGTRRIEVGKILEFVKSGLSSQLIGLQGAGKSNVLNLLAYNRNVRISHLGEDQAKYHFVYMDFSEIKGRASYDAIKFILISLVYSLNERRMKEEAEEVNKLIKEAIDFRDDLILFQALKKSIDFLALEKKLAVVLLFDRFEQYFHDISDQFFSSLKILRNRAKYRFSCVFSLSRPIEQILDENIYSGFQEFFSGNEVYLVLYDKVGTDFRLDYLDKATHKKTSVERKDEIIKLTSGHGKLTRISYELILSEKEIENLESFLNGKGVVEKACLEIWDALTPSEQNILIKLSKSEKSEIPEYINNVELVKNGRINIPLFEDFIKKLKTVKQTIVYDEGKNEILKGQDNLTDILTPSEFKLLRYLITNKDKTCEKEEIINAVWKDSKTQEGVTDQALDQIVYRLRKKIEDDPNNPTFIQTIKGRGFKFIG